MQEPFPQRKEYLRKSKTPNFSLGSTRLKNAMADFKVLCLKTLTHFVSKSNVLLGGWLDNLDFLCNFLKFCV